MEECKRTQQDLNLATRKAEEAALRRFQATEWLESLVGPTGLPSQPTEKEFICCLRSGLILCNAINKIKPGSVPKVVLNNSSPQSLIWDSQPLPAYQYFENVRNFLVAVEELKLTSFDASVLERDNLEAVSSAKVVDCILELKAYGEWKQWNGGKGFLKPQKWPMVMHPVGRIHSRGTGANTLPTHDQVDMATTTIKEIPDGNESQKLEESIVTALAECMIDRKEIIEANLLSSFCSGDPDAINSLKKTVINCLDEKIQNRLPELKPFFDDILQEESSSITQPTTTPIGNSLTLGRKSCRACLGKGSCNHYQLFQMQEKELSNLKSLLSSTKEEFVVLKFQFQRDMEQLGREVQEMSAAALGYHKVVKENMNLYNMVQDLKGSIRVYCRIRPPFSAQEKNVIDFVGQDGSLGVSDPLKPQKDGRRVFRFDRVFGPTATQDEVFKETQPLIRSVMDGYNVCILAYGQTGSGKTHTMCGPSTGLSKELGINYLALDDLFHLANERKDIIKYDIHVQMVEIYNEQVRDLLAEDSSATKLEIRSCASDNNLSLPRATMHGVISTGDVLNLMKLGELNRAVSSTAMNNQSSRSHSILTVHVHGKDVSGSMLRSCLHLVDLAGSERVDKSEVTGDELKEAQYINKSLSCLGDVMTALAQKNSHIPYRNSKLTLLLQHSLGGHAKTLMFAHVSPEGDSFGETVSTLKFAQRVSTVELGAARPQRESSEVMELKEELESLRRALSCKEPQTAEVKTLKENRSPFETSKSMTSRTPPRSRRLSIETPTVLKMERAQSIKPKEAKTPTDRTPPRPRRLSIENSSVVKMDKTHPNKQKETKSPPLKSVTDRTPLSRRLSIETPSVVKMEKLTELKSSRANPKVVAETTPTLSRRLSTENCNSTNAQKAANLEDKKVPITPSVQSRARRLSLEGPKYVSKSLSVHHTAPKSPTSSDSQSQPARAESVTKIPSLQRPRPPEPGGFMKRLESPTTNMKTGTNGKASQIRKSIRAIGKLINGSEKRNQQKQTEHVSPFIGASIIPDDLRSPGPPLNPRTLRRQSLTGIQPLNSSRRTSLGGNPNEYYGSRNAKTPPVQQPKRLL